MQLPACSEKKIKAEWTPEMEAQATEFYLRNYSDSFSAPDIDIALATIPQASRPCMQPLFASASHPCVCSVHLCGSRVPAAPAASIRLGTRRLADPPAPLNLRAPSRWSLDGRSTCGMM